MRIDAHTIQAYTVVLSQQFSASPSPPTIGVLELELFVPDCHGVYLPPTLGTLNSPVCQE